MKIYDITKEMLGCAPYPGDRPADLVRIKDIETDDYNLSELFLSVHSGTHIDTPLHFQKDGADAASLALSACVGDCLVVDTTIPLDPSRALCIVKNGDKRILLKGHGALSPETAGILADGGVVFLGVECDSPSTPENTAATHSILMRQGGVIAENLDLSGVGPGKYFLFAAPLKISGAEGSPSRAVLIDFSAD